MCVCLCLFVCVCVCGLVLVIRRENRTFSVLCFLFISGMSEIFVHMFSENIIKFHENLSGWSPAGPCGQTHEQTWRR
jgi:hypothetical protein